MQSMIYLFRNFTFRNIHLVISELSDRTWSSFVIEITDAHMSFSDSQYLRWQRRDLQLLEFGKLATSLLMKFFRKYNDVMTIIGPCIVAWNKRLFFLNLYKQCRLKITLQKHKKIDWDLVQPILDFTKMIFVETKRVISIVSFPIQNVFH